MPVSYTHLDPEGDYSVAEEVLIVELKPQADAETVCYSVHKMGQTCLLYTSITELMLAEVKEQCLEKGIAIEIKPEVVTFLSKNGFDEKYGARPLRRLIQSRIEDELAERHLRGELQPGAKVVVRMEQDTVCFDIL